MNHCPCLISHLYFLKTYPVSTFSSCVFFFRLSSQILYLRTPSLLSYSYELNIYIHRPIRHCVTHENSTNLDMFVHCNALCFFHHWCAVFKASNISLRVKIGIPLFCNVCGFVITGSTALWSPLGGITTTTLPFIFFVFLFSVYSLFYERQF
jgi:hypothetical protein